MSNETSTKNIIEIMRRQFQSNESKNIFCTDNQLYFNTNTNIAIQQLRDKLSLLSKSDINCIIRHYRNSFLEQFYKVDQYTYFSKDAEFIIERICIALLQDLQNTNLTNKELEYRHYNRIRKLIKITNPAIFHINNNANPQAHLLVCSEYSADFLIQLLALDKQRLIEPILDIGCGRNANLINYMRNIGIEAYGIDRNIPNFTDSTLFNADWFEFDYGVSKWGTIISNLSFCSHFLYHHLQNDELANTYAYKFMEILNSLKIGGTWIYAPSIPFFEDLLPKEKYTIKRIKINEDFSRSEIIKLM
ncbi:class I SAM-dependent methyltransferase [Clostridium sp. MB40-C1]|uniref:class I SAM-dependent methyltransferase n=1 Tax=Clostridium sp. MB40-C1 TaxID=3070996 RepID=UPI0027E15615|nr:class I SAM-dependent methyltransferase [Clostridium sp. MB40-C1]WMJ81650.1 class I SAM-dependent methyltransferase [Clostridium sp. MB40-C1]